MEHCGAQDLSCPQLLQDLVGLTKRKYCRLGPDPGLRCDFQKIQPVLARAALRTARSAAGTSLPAGGVDDGGIKRAIGQLVRRADQR